MLEYFIFTVKPDPFVSKKPYIGAQCASGLAEVEARKLLPSSAIHVKKVQAKSAKEAVKLYGKIEEKEAA